VRRALVLLVMQDLRVCKESKVNQEPLEFRVQLVRPARRAPRARPEYRDQPDLIGSALGAQRPLIQLETQYRLRARRM